MTRPLRLSHLLVIGAAAMLAVTGGLAAGFTARGSPPPPPPDHSWCPAASTSPTAGSGCPEPATGPPAATPPTPATAPEPDSLRALASPQELRIGSAVDIGALDDEGYRSVLAREFNAVTAENAMKWGALEPAPGEPDRRDADRLIAFAQRHNQEVYGHTLIWHRQVPGWVDSGQFSVEQLRAVLRRHVQDQVSYFQGEVWAWDVVNEPLDEDGTLRDSIWLRELGPDYLADAFQWARAADPDAALFLNDYGIEGRNVKSDALYDLVRQLLADGVPVDGVGFQVHWTLDPLPASFVDNLTRFGELGLQVAITEMDVRIPEPATPERLEQQAAVYAEGMQACLAVPACVSFTVWGFTDAHSWVPEVYPDSGSAALFDQDLVPKPAYAAVADALRRPERSDE